MAALKCSCGKDLVPTIRSKRGESIEYVLVCNGPHSQAAMGITRRKLAPGDLRVQKPGDQVDRGQ